MSGQFRLEFGLCQITEKKKETGKAWLKKAPWREKNKLWCK